jgi:hypothetical protein
VRELLAVADRAHREAIEREKAMADESMVAADIVVALTAYASSKAVRLFMHVMTQLIFNPWGTFPLITSNIRFAPNCAFHGPLGYEGSGPSIALYLVILRNQTLVTFQTGGGLAEKAHRLAEAMREVGVELGEALALDMETTPKLEP